MVGRLRHPSLSGWAELVHVAFIVMACGVLVVLARRREVVLGLGAGWLLAGVVASVVGVWEVVTHRHLSKHMPARYYEKWWWWNKIASFFDNPNLYAYMMLITLQVTIIGFFWARGWWRLPFVAMAGLFVHQLSWTDSRFGMIFLLLTVGLLALRHRVGRWLAAAGVVGVVAAFALRLGPAMALWDRLLDLWEARNRTGDSENVRLNLIRAGWRFTQDSDYLGIGPGGFQLRAGLESNPFRVRTTSPHWGMVEVVSGYGVLSLAALLGTLALGIVACVRVNRQLKRDGLGTWSGQRVLGAMTAIMLGLVPLVSLMHSSWLSQPMTALHLATLAALVQHAITQDGRMRLSSDL